MGLTKNQYGGIDLPATAADMDKRLAAIEEKAEGDLKARFEALERDVAAIKSALTHKEDTLDQLPATTEGAE